MKFEILNRFTGKVQFTAEIECDENALLNFPAETSQQKADRLLREWQMQRAAGIRPERRELPDDSFHRDLEIIRQVMSRK